MFAFYFVSFLVFVGKIRVLASLVGGDDQAKCKWIFGISLSH